MGVRVVLADDQPLIRTGLRVLIADTPDLEVVGEAGTGAEAVRLAADVCADVVVMDIRMPGVDGIAATRTITAGAASARVLILTTFDDDDYVYAALRAGASGSWSRTWLWRTSSRPSGSWPAATPSSRRASPVA
jgi:DNA-binding NarL/FixJ family response regulator